MSAESHRPRNELEGPTGEPRAGADRFGTPDRGRCPLVTLTTDFGTFDTFVGQMKGQVLNIAPRAQIVDLTHEIPPQDIMAGCLAIESAADAFPAHTVHVVVVDPGVGSNRAAIAVRTDRGTFVGPDNGVFTSVLGGMRFDAVALSIPTDRRSVVSSTFHGRDVFASAAAHLANGVPMNRLGEPVERLVRLEIPMPATTSNGLEIRVLWIDRFGNLITNLTVLDLEAWRSKENEAPIVLDVCGRSIPGIRRTYADVEPGQPVAYIGSGGRLEIAVRNGSAASTFGAERDATIHLRAEA